MHVFLLIRMVQVLLGSGSKVEIVTLWYGGRLALRGQMDFGELSSAVLVAQSAFDGARPGPRAPARCRRIWRTSGFPKLQIAMQNSGWPFSFEQYLGRSHQNKGASRVMASLTFSSLLVCCFFLSKGWWQTATCHPAGAGLLRQLRPMSRSKLLGSSTSTISILGEAFQLVSLR